MLYILLPTLFIFGLAFGSFLNAFEYRLFTKKDWVKARSHCPNCKHELSALDLVPVFSWLFLGGKCRYCSKKISWQYPVVELVLGVLFVVYGWVAFGGILGEQIYQFPTIVDFTNLIFGLIVIWSLVFFTVYDLKYGLIPDKVLFPLICLTLVRNIIFYVLRIQNSLSPFLADFNFWNHILAAVLAGGFFFLVIYFTKGRGMGGGDMKLVFWFGLLLGGAPTLVSLYIGFIVGGIYGAVVLLIGKKKFGQTVPFGPFLCLGAIIVLLAQDYLVDWANQTFFGGIL